MPTWCPDGKLGVAADIESWHRGRDVPDLVRGRRWQVVPQEAHAKPVLPAKPRPPWSRRPSPTCPACLGNMLVIVPGMWIAHDLRWFVLGPGANGIEYSVLQTTCAVA